MEMWWGEIFRLTLLAFPLHLALLKYLYVSWLPVIIHCCITLVTQNQQPLSRSRDAKSGKCDYIWFTERVKCNYSWMFDLFTCNYISRNVTTFNLSGFTAWSENRLRYRSFIFAQLRCNISSIDSGQQKHSSSWYPSRKRNGVDFAIDCGFFTYNSLPPQLTWNDLIAQVEYYLTGKLSRSYHILSTFKSKLHLFVSKSRGVSKSVHYWRHMSVTSFQITSTRLCLKSCSD